MLDIKVSHIKKVDHDIGNGITEPKFAFDDDNTSMVIKVFNGVEGNLVLFNEYFCYRLAILLGMEMPKSGVCALDSYTIDDNALITKDNFGKGFYSTYYPKVAPLLDTIIPLIKNKWDFYKIILFDHLIFNTDRNYGNLLVQFYKSNVSLKVIDHSHVFINQSIWNARCLNDGIKDKDYNSTKILEYNSTLYNMFFACMSCNRDILKDTVDLFKNTITCDIMYKIISEIPEEWLPSEKDLEALINYLKYRIKYLDNIGSIIERYWKS